MGRHQAPRAPLQHPLQDRLREGGALVGIGAGAELVDQHQGALVGALHHCLEVVEVAGVGAQAGLDALLVPDVAQQRVDPREPGRLSPRSAAGARRPTGRHEEPARRHHRRQPEGLEEHRLAAGVRSGHHQQAVLRGQLERVGDATLDERVAGVGEHHASGLVDLGAGEAPVAGEAGAGVGEVELRHDLEGLVDGRLGRQPLPQRQQDAPDLVPLLDLQQRQLVVHGHHRGRLDEDGGPRIATVHRDAGHARLRTRPDGDDVAVAPQGDDGLLHAAGVGLQEPCQALADAPPQRLQATPDVGQLGCSVVTDVAVGVELLADHTQHPIETPDAGGQRRQRGPPAALNGAPQRGRRVQRVGHRQDLASLEQVARPHALQQRPHVLDAAERQVAAHHHLVHARQRRVERILTERGHHGQSPFDAQARGRSLRQGRPHAPER